MLVMLVPQQVWRPFGEEKVTMQPGFDEAYGKALARQDQKKTSPAVLNRRSHEKKTGLTRYGTS